MNTKKSRRWLISGADFCFTPRQPYSLDVLSQHCVLICSFRLCEQCCVSSSTSWMKSYPSQRETSFNLLLLIKRPGDEKRRRRFYGTEKKGPILGRWKNKSGDLFQRVCVWTGSASFIHFESGLSNNLFTHRIYFSHSAEISFGQQASDSFAPNKISSCWKHGYNFVHWFHYEWTEGMLRHLLWSVYFGQLEGHRWGERRENEFFCVSHSKVGVIEGQGFFQQTGSRPLKLQVRQEGQLKTTYRPLLHI